MPHPNQGHENLCAPGLKRKAGLTFIEIMIAVCVLAIGIIPAFHVFFRGNAGTIMMRDEILANTYAAELIDSLHARGFDAVGVEQHKEVPTLSESLPIESRFHRYLTVIHKVPSGGCADWPITYKIIQVDINWEASGRQHSFVLTSLLFKGQQ